MKGLRELIDSPEGRLLLAEAGIFTDPHAFLAAAAPAATPLPGAEPAILPIYVHQQPCVDYRRSVAVKLRALDAVRRVRPDAIDAVFVLIDTDRAASSKAATRIAWEDAQGRRHRLKLTPPGSDALEFRHLLVDPRQLDRIADRLRAWLRQMPGDRAKAIARLDALRPLLVPADAMPMSRYAATIGSFLLDARLDVRLRTMMVSDLADDGALAPSLATILDGLDEFRAVFNARVAALHAAGIETAVAEVAEDYLPLFYSCPIDGTRLRLRKRRIGGDLHAVAESPAGRRYAFPLGDRGTNLEVLYAAGRWSPDVTLPILLNDRFSGMVAGRSSALYSLVLTATMRAALAMRPIPILVPAALAADCPGPDGLLQAWLTG